MKLIKFVTIIMFFLMSCEKTNEEPICLNFDLAFQLEIIDSAENDLLNPNFGDSFNHSEISYYKLNENNKVEMILNDNFIIKPSNEISNYFLNITELGTKQPDSSYLSYLKLSNDITDTIKVKVIEKNCSVSKDKIFYNGKLVWDKASLNTLPIIITK